MFQVSFASSIVGADVAQSDSRTGLSLDRGSFDAAIDQILEELVKRANKFSYFERHKLSRKPRSFFVPVLVHPAGPSRIAALIVMKPHRRLDQHLVESLGIAFGAQPDLFPDFMCLVVTSPVEMRDARQVFARIHVFVVYVEAV